MNPRPTNLRSASVRNAAVSDSNCAAAFTAFHLGLHLRRRLRLLAISYTRIYKTQAQRDALAAAYCTLTAAASVTGMAFQGQLARREQQ